MGTTNRDTKKVVFSADFKTALKLEVFNELAKTFPDKEFIQLMIPKNCQPQDQYFFYELKSKKPFPIPLSN